jgi:hypothetical protein
MFLAICLQIYQKLLTTAQASISPESHAKNRGEMTAAFAGAREKN